MGVKNDRVEQMIAFDKAFIDYLAMVEHEGYNRTERGFLENVRYKLDEFLQNTQPNSEE